MNLVCKKTVQDKDTGKWYVKDTEYRFTEDRAKELLESGCFKDGTRSEINKNVGRKRKEAEKQEATIEDNNNESND